jgi:hypothetical protein
MRVEDAFQQRRAAARQPGQQCEFRSIFRSAGPPAREVFGLDILGQFHQWRHQPIAVGFGFARVRGRQSLACEHRLPRFRVVSLLIQQLRQFGAGAAPR